VREIVLPSECDYGIEAPDPKETGKGVDRERNRAKYKLQNQKAMGERGGNMRGEKGVCSSGKTKSNTKPRGGKIEKERGYSSSMGQVSQSMLSQNKMVGEKWSGNGLGSYHCEPD